MLNCHNVPAAVCAFLIVMRSISEKDSKDGMNADDSISTYNEHGKEKVTLFNLFLKYCYTYIILKFSAFHREFGLLDVVLILGNSFCSS